MRINRILTNNAVIIQNDGGKEQIVCGKGIGFKKKIGDSIDESLVNKTFILFSDVTLLKQFEQLLHDLPLEYIEIANEISKMVKVISDDKLQDSFVISLADHIYETIRRYNEGINISNGLIWEIKRFYEKEFEIGLLAKDMIDKHFNIHLPEDEAAYIATHIVNAQTIDSTITETVKITHLIQDITKIIRINFQTELDENSGYYYRFITHLKYFARRVLRRENNINDDVSDLSIIIFKKYPEAFECTKMIQKYVKDNMNYDINDEEKMYLTIHIHSLVSKCIKKV